MDVSEVKKLDAYLSKLFGNPNIRVVPKKGDIAEVFIGEDDLGELTVDDEDGDRSFNFRMVIQVSNDPSFAPVPTLTTYLRAKFDNEQIRVVTRPKKTDSLEAYIGDEFLGVLFLETEKGRAIRDRLKLKLPLASRAGFILRGDFFSLAPRSDSISLN